ncbi:S8 family serine peptidase [Longimicrobium sp.]|uniref:S8 family serine peptidase n=1 Tax=Longimicrobium sp. TaxID=2029185 RepID=UPI003B3BAA48
MKRLIALAACMLTLAACQDHAGPVDAAPEAAPSNLLGLIPPVVKIDPTLTTLLNLASPTDKLQVLVAYDEKVTNSRSIAGALTSLGAGILKFKNLPVVFTVATPAQIASITTRPGVTGVYSNKQLEFYLAESTRAVRATDAWNAGFTGKGVGIAILDSGVDGLYNAGLQYGTKTVHNAKFIADLGDLLTLDPTLPAPGGKLFVANLPTSETSMGHGTHVAGIAAGNGASSNGGYYRGVAPDATLIGIGAGDAVFVLWALAGLDYILDIHEQYNIQVVNNSWGSSGVYDPAHPINVATRKLYDAGVAVVFAAGNEGPGENTLNPYSAAPWVISVAAGCKMGISPEPTNGAAQCADGRGNILADFSSRGISGDPLVHPDITAPGVNIVSTRAVLGVLMSGLDLPADVMDCNISSGHLPYYTCAGGTSMAAPHVAGAIAVLEEAAGGQLSPSAAYTALIRTAVPLPGYAEWEVGAGFMDVYAATRYVRQ